MNKQTKKTKAAGEDDEGFSSYPVSYIPNKSGTFVINIRDPLVHSGQFDDAIQVLGMADEDCDVLINISTPGGSLQALDTFLHALRKTRCNVHMVGTGMVASAGTVLLLQADSFELSEDFIGMIHNGSLGAGGNFNEYIEMARFYGPWMENFMRKSYKHFLTEKEINELLAGRDFYMGAEEWCRRAEIRFAAIRAEYEESINPKPVKKPRVKKAKASVVE